MIWDCSGQLRSLGKTGIFWDSCDPSGSSGITGDSQDQLGSLTPSFGAAPHNDPKAKPPLGAFQRDIPKPPLGATTHPFQRDIPSAPQSPNSTRTGMESGNESEMDQDYGNPS